MGLEKKILNNAEGVRNVGNDDQSHIFCISFVKNSSGGTASTSNEWAGFPTKKVIEL